MVLGHVPGRHSGCVLTVWTLVTVTGPRGSGSGSSCKTGYPHVGGGHGQGPLGTWQKDMLMWAGPLWCPGGNPGPLRGSFLSCQTHGPASTGAVGPPGAPYQALLQTHSGRAAAVATGWRPCLQPSGWSPWEPSSSSNLKGKATGPLHVGLRVGPWATGPGQLCPTRCCLGGSSHQSRAPSASPTHPGTAVVRFGHP